MKPSVRIVARINVPRQVCHHLMGHDHTAHHRMICGVAVMACGVLVSKVHVEALPVLHYVMDGIGYFIHGVGAVPFIEHLLAQELGAAKSAVESLEVSPAGEEE